MGVATKKIKELVMFMKKSLLKKSLTSLALTACAVCAISSVSYASISWDSDATYTGVGGRANVYAYTSQNNEPWYYKIYVEASTNDGSNDKRWRDPATSTDIVSVSFTTTGPVISGNSYHEWVLSGDSAGVHKSIDFH